MVVSEDGSNVLLGLGVKFMGWSLATMIMFGCRLGFSR